MTPPEAAAIGARQARARESFLHRAMRRSFDDWRSTAQVSLLMCRIALRLRRGDFVALLDSYGLREEIAPASAVAQARAQQLVRWAHCVVPIAPNCLLDSVTAAVWLRRRGLRAPLSIGVRLTGGVVEAHAWLGECADSAQNFRLLYSTLSACADAAEPPR